MGKSASEKLWSIKIKSGVAVLFKGGERVPKFRNVVGASVVASVVEEDSPSCAGTSDTNVLVSLEFTPVDEKNKSFQFASAKPKYFNRFDCDGPFKDIEERTAESLAEGINQGIQRLKTQHDKTAPPQDGPQSAAETGARPPQEQQLATTTARPSTAIRPSTSRPQQADQQRQKRQLPPLYSRTKKHKPKNEESTHVTGIQQRCNECLLDNDTHFIAIEKLVVPPEKRKIRAVDDHFLTKLVENIKAQPLGSYEPLFVLAKGVKSLAEFDKGRLKEYEYEVLGGTHLTLATKQLHGKFPTNSSYNGRVARIYVGLTDEEALWLGAMHNNTGAFRHNLKYKDEVEICRRQLFVGHEGSECSDPPEPARSWREMCSHLLDKSKKNLCEVFTMAQLPHEGWNHFQTVHRMFENGELKDQKVKAGDIVKTGKPVMKQWHLKSLCSLSPEDQTFLLGKVVQMELSLEELQQSAKQIKSLKPVQEAILDFFKMNSWEDVQEQFQEDVEADRLLRFAGKGFEQSHDFQTFLVNLKRRKEHPSGTADTSSDMFTGRSGSVGLPLFCCSLEDITPSSLAAFPNFRGAFLVVGQAGESCRDTSELLNVVSRLNLMQLTSFNVVLTVNCIDNVKELKRRMMEQGAIMTQTGHFYAQKPDRNCQGPALNNALTTFVVGHWSVSRDVTTRHSTYGGGNVIAVPESGLSHEAFSWLVKHMSREGDAVLDIGSREGGCLVAALQQGRDAVWLSTAEKEDRPNLLRRLVEQLHVDVDVDEESVQNDESQS